MVNSREYALLAGILKNGIRKHGHGRGLSDGQAGESLGRTHWRGIVVGDLVTKITNVAAASPRLASRSCELRLLQLSVSNALKVIIKT